MHRVSEKLRRDGSTLRCAEVATVSTANNTLSFKTDQAFDGTWNIQTKYAKFYKKIKADQKYTGSFQTQKDIKFQDARQN